MIQQPVKPAGGLNVGPGMRTQLLTIDEAAEQMNIAGGKPTTRGRLYGRLIALGYGKECSRCGGEGRWFSGVCWGCNGARYTLPASALSVEVIAEARRRQDAGELQTYFNQAWARKHSDVGPALVSAFRALGEFARSRGCLIDAASPATS